MLKNHWTELELKQHWSLSRAEEKTANAKSNPFVYAVKLKYFNFFGIFPNDYKDIAKIVLKYIAAQLKLNITSVAHYDWQSRTSQIHNTHIREYYGFRKFQNSDWNLIQKQVHSCFYSQGMSAPQILDEIYVYCKKLKIEPSSSKEFNKKIKALYIASEDKFFQECTKNIDSNAKKQIDRLLGLHEKEMTILNYIRLPSSKLSRSTIPTELAKLDYLEGPGIIYKKAFDNIPRKLLKKYYDRVAISTPSLLLERKVSRAKYFYGMLACFIKYKASKIIDNFVLFIIKKIGQFQETAKIALKQKLWQDYTNEEEKDTLYYSMIDVSLDYPNGVIIEKMYPAVGGRNVLENAKSSINAMKQERKFLRFEHLRKAYVSSVRRDILTLLGRLKLKNYIQTKLIQATDFIIKHQDSALYKKEFYLEKPSVETKDIISKSYIKTIEDDNIGVRKYYYEIAVLISLRRELRCKNIWCQGAFKYFDPDKDLPKILAKNDNSYYDMLGVPSNAQDMIKNIKKEMGNNLSVFNESIIKDTDVRIGKKKDKSHIYLTPYDAQEHPDNLKLLKSEIKLLWPDVGLLDILKEADLRIGLTSEIIKIADKTSLDTYYLHRRLLLALFAIGTNTEFNKVCGGSFDIEESDLRYVKKRFITVESLRYVIRKLVNATLEIRDSRVWGNTINSFASDSTKFAAWSGNIMSEYHSRYQGYGVMAYWHVDKKALCISSQLTKCNTSEVAAMLKGIISHGTDANIKTHSTDTHGQSLVAFAFAHLLNIDLRPRIKGIGRMSLYKPDSTFAQSNYYNIKEVIERPIIWRGVIEHYQEMVRHAVALSLGKSEPEILFKKFIRDNIKSPLYKAILELGRSKRTIFLCQYLSSKNFRIEIEEALQVIENWNSGNNYVFFGKRGVISTNDENEQEISILCLHLLQSALVYINTLMVQKVLYSPNWQVSLTTEDKRALTPLFYTHVNQYGLYRLDMNKRLEI